MEMTLARIKEMPHGEQFSVFDRIAERMKDLNEEEIENGALNWLIEIIDDEVSASVAE